MSATRGGDVKYRDKVSVRVNVKLILAVVAVLLVSGVGSYFLRNFWIDRNSGALLARAEKRQANDDLAGAITDIGHYLKLRPKDYDAMLKLATWIESGKPTQQSALRLHRILGEYLTQDPSRNDVRKRFVKLSVQMQRYREVLDEQLPLLKDEVVSDPELLDNIDRCYVATEAFDKSAQLCRQAITNDEENPSNYTRLVRLLEVHGSKLKETDVDSLSSSFRVAAVGDAPSKNVDAPAPDKAEAVEELIRKVLAEMLDKARPEEIDARVAMASHNYLRNELDEAEKNVAAALKRDPDNREANVLAIDIALRRRDRALADRDSDAAAAARAKAQQLAQTAITRPNADWRIYLILGRLALEDRNIDGAEENYSKAIEAAKQIVEARPATEQSSADSITILFRSNWALSDLLLSSMVQKDPARREKALQRLDEVAETLQNLKVRPVLIELLAARRLAADRKWSQAADQLEKLRPDLEAFPDQVRAIDETLVECYDQLQNPDMKAKAYERGLQTDPTWIAGRLGLASLKASQGQEQAALDQLGQASQSGLLAVSSLRMRMNQQMRRPPEKRDWTAIEKAVTAAEKSDRWNPDAAALRAELLFLQGKPDEAEKHMAEACDRNPENLALAERRIGFVLAQTQVPADQRVAQAQPLLDAARQKFGDQPALRILNAQLVVLENPQGAEARLRGLADNVDELTTAQRVLVYRGLMAYAESAGASGLAIELAERAALLEPDNVENLMQLAIAALNQNDDARLTAAVEKIRKVEGAKGPNSSFLQGALKMREARKLLSDPNQNSTANEDPAVRKKRLELVEEARVALTEAVASRQSWALAHRMLGGALLQLGRESEAHEEFQKALQNGDRSRETVMVIASYLQRNKKDEEIVELIRSVEEFSPLLVPEEVARAGVASAIRINQLKVADQFSENIQTQTLTDKITRAQLLMARREKPAEVETLLREATEMGPDQPLAWYTRTAFLIRENRREEAEKVVNEAMAALPAEPQSQRLLTLGILNEILGDLTKADALLGESHGKDTHKLAAINEHINFYLRHGQVNQARALLKLLLAPDSGLTDEQRALASRVAAELQGVAATTYTEFEEAVRSLGGEKDLATVAPADLRSLAQVLSRSRLRRDQLRLIDVLKQLDEADSGLKVAEQRQLAWLYEQNDRRDDAFKIYRKLQAADQTDVLAISAFIQAAAEEKNPGRELISELEQAVERLRTLEPRSFRSALGQSRLFALQDQPEKAANELNRFLENLKETPPPLLFRELVSLRRDAATVQALQESFTKLEPQKVRGYLASIQQLRNGNDPDAAAAALRTPLGNRAVQEKLRGEFIKLVAQVFEGMKRPDDAEAAYKRLVAESSPENSTEGATALASFYARIGRIQDGLALCKELEDRIPAAVFSQLIVAVARAGKADSEVCAGIEQQLIGRLKAISSQRVEQPAQDAPRAVRQAYARSVAEWNDAVERVSLSLADLYDFQARFDQASKVYEELLRRNPNQVVALNNLAWIESFNSDAARKANALKLVNRAIELAGPLPDLLDTRAVVSINLGQPSAAVADLTQALNEVARPTLWLHLAVAQLKAGARDAAATTFKKAQDAGLDPASLHPLEVAMHDELQKAFGSRGGATAG